MSEESLRAIPAWRESASFDAAERAALGYAEAMTALPFAVDEPMFDELRTCFSERQVVELTAAIAWENFRARFNHALGVESQEFAVCAVPWARELPGVRAE